MRRNPRETADLAPFTEETLNGKLHCLCSESFFFPPKGPVALRIIKYTTIIQTS